MNNTPFTPTPIALALTAALATPISTVAMAEPSATGNKVFALDKVTVAATLTEQKIKDVSNTVSVLTSEAISENGATDIREMLRYETGIEVGSAGRFGLKGFNIRGMDENQVKILVDGITQDDSFNPGANFQRVNRNPIDIDTLKQVEVVKGPGSTLYGSNSIGGTVVFTTKDPTDYLKPQGDDITLTIGESYNSADEELKSSITLAGRTGTVEALLAFTHRDGNKLETQGTASGEGETRTIADPSNKESENILAKLQWHISEAHRLEFTLEDYQSEVQSNLLSENEFNDYSMYFGPGEYLSYANKSSDDSFERQRISLKHLWQANNTAFDTMSWQLSQQNSDTTHKTYDDVETSFLVGMIFGVPNGVRLKDYSHEVDTQQLDITFNKSIGNHTITYGLNKLEKDIDNQTNTFYLENQAPTEQGRYIPKVDSSSLGIFAQAQLNLLEDQLLLTTGIRYDDFEASAATDAQYTTELKDHDSDKMSLRLGSVYKITEATSVFTQYAQGFRAPDANDLYNQREGANYLHLANPELKPEESDSFEIGVRTESSIGSIEFSAFYNDYDNYIEQEYLNFGAPYTSGVSQNVNVAEATIKGAEIRSTLWLDETLGAPTGMALNLSMAYASGEGKASSDADSKPIDSIAPMKTIIGLSYESPNGKWGSILNTTLVKGKNKNDIAEEGNFTPGSYDIVDLTAYLKPIKALTLRASIHNIGDTKYWIWDDVRGVEEDKVGLDSYTQPGRNFSLSMNYQF